MSIRKLLNSLCILSFIGLLVMLATSYTHYTSVGIDSDQWVSIDRHNNRIADTAIQYRYYRIKWPDNGSIWLRGGSSLRPIDSPKPFEGFDLAATFFYPNPELPKVKSSYNKLGF